MMPIKQLEANRADFTLAAFQVTRLRESTSLIVWRSSPCRSVLPPKPHAAVLHLLEVTKAFLTTSCTTTSFLNGKLQTDGKDLKN